MSGHPNALHQSGSDIVPIFPSKQYVSFPQQAICRQPQKHKFIRTQKNILYRPIQVQNQIVDYEILNFRPGDVEGNIQPFRNVGEHLNQAFRTIQVENRKLIELISQLGKQVEKY